MCNITPKQLWFSIHRRNFCSTLVILLTLFEQSRSQSISSACTYSAPQVTWSCVTPSLHVNHSHHHLVPLNYTHFRSGAGDDVIILELTSFYGVVPNNTFSTFSGRSSGTMGGTGGVLLNKLPEPTLIFRCDDQYQRFISWDIVSFRGLSFIRNLEFYGCEFHTFPPGSLAPFSQLLSLRIDGGVLNNLFGINGRGFFSGVNVAPDPFLRGTGSVYISASMPSTSRYRFFPIGFLSPLANATRLTLKDNGINLLLGNMLAGFSKLTYFEFSGQHVNRFPENFFSHIRSSVSYIRLYDIRWYCACANLWLFDWLDQSGIKWKGDFLCSHPTSLSGYSLLRYRQDYCTETSLDLSSRAVMITLTTFSIALVIFSGLIWIIIIPLWQRVIICELILNPPDEKVPRVVSESQADTMQNLRKRDHMKKSLEFESENRLKIIKPSQSFMPRGVVQKHPEIIVLPAIKLKVSDKGRSNFPSNESESDEPTIIDGEAYTKQGNKTADLLMVSSLSSLSTDSKHLRSKTADETKPVLEKDIPALHVDNSDDLEKSSAIKANDPESLKLEVETKASMLRTEDDQIDTHALYDSFDDASELDGDTQVSGDGYQSDFEGYSDTDSEKYTSSDVGSGLGTRRKANFRNQMNARASLPTRDSTKRAKIVKGKPKKSEPIEVPNKNRLVGQKKIVSDGKTGGNKVYGKQGKETKTSPYKDQPYFIPGATQAHTHI